MNRLLLYVHFNKWDGLSSHVEYQLERIRPLFSSIIFLSNSQLPIESAKELKKRHLVDVVIQRENVGYDFAAWRDGMEYIGFEQLAQYDSITLMNDTCFGPLWDMEEIYKRFEEDETVDFWGMTNFRRNWQFKEHIQSYYLSFSNKVIQSQVFRDFWRGVQNFTKVQDVIDNYETKVTTSLLDAGFCYQTVFDTVNADITGMRHPDFSYYNPTAILKHKVPFIKIKAIDANQHIIPYILNEIERRTVYPVDLIVSHMSRVSYPDEEYLLARKYLPQEMPIVTTQQSVAIHLHVFYVDLLAEFLEAFALFHFDYDLFITTDIEEKCSEIHEILMQFHQSATLVVTGNVGRDILPMLKLKDVLKQYEFVGHFHTKKSKEADYWAGESWRNELIDMLVRPANRILASMQESSDLGIVIADIPTFFRYNKIVTAKNEHKIAPLMNHLWRKMKLKKSIDFGVLHTFVMSYGTYVWFRYDALKPLFDLGLTDADVPTEPLSQNSILHAIERLLIYIAWDRQYDFRISKNPVELTPFIDNKRLNQRQVPWWKLQRFGGIAGLVSFFASDPKRFVRLFIKKMKQKLGMV